MTNAGEAYPYRSHAIGPNFITVKLSSKIKYDLWRMQMECLIKSQHMVGFIDGQSPIPERNVKGKVKVEDMEAWDASDSLVKGWILGSLSEEAVNSVVNHLTHIQKKTEFTAKDLWDGLRRIYDPLAASSSNPSFIVDVGEGYPYPSVIGPNFVTMKLSGKDTYNVWETQILCLLKSHQMYGFIAGQFPSPAGNRKGKVGDMEAWTISDSLVKGWILGSLSDGVAKKVVSRLKHKHRNTDFTAKDLWDELQRSYSPSETKETTRQADSEIMEEKEDEFFFTVGNPFTHTFFTQKTVDEFYARRIYEEILEGNTIYVIDRLKTLSLNPWDTLTNNGNAILHVAVGSSTKNHELLKKLLEMTPPDNTLLDLVNSDGSTLLHVAAIGGNTEVVDILVKRNPEWLLAKDKEGHTPLALSISNMHTKTSHCLFEHMKVHGYGYLFSGPSGEKLVILAISCQDFRLAKMIIDDYPDAILSDSEAVLMALAQNFPRELNFWERGWKQEFTRIAAPNASTVERLWNYADSSRGRQPLKILIILFAIFFSALFVLATTLVYQFAKVLVRPFIEDTSQIHKDATDLLLYVRYNYRTYHQYYTSTLEATRRNASTFIRVVMKRFPNAIWSTNEDGHNFIQYSVISRSEKIYNLLYEMSEHKNIYKTIKDSSGNNLLHLAARLAPINKLNLISGAALQVQRELQWFKEVERFVCPLNRMQKNLDGETPQEVFTREHKDLVIEGENWIRKTAESYTITAALIITIVFAAAITVPGGNNQESGVPIFTNNIAFTLFAISNAISLFTAVTSLLLFLSILTARFAEQDFLFKLPTKLIIGLTMLFLSTTAMIIAFGATLFLVFGQGNSSMLIPIGALTCLPITSFVTLQFPLILELIRATYCGGFFGREGYGYFY